MIRGIAAALLLVGVSTASAQTITVVSTTYNTITVNVALDSTVAGTLPQAGFGYIQMVADGVTECPTLGTGTATTALGRAGWISLWNNVHSSATGELVSGEELPLMNFVIRYGHGARTVNIATATEFADEPLMPDTNYCIGITRRMPSNTVLTTDTATLQTALARTQMPTMAPPNQPDAPTFSNITTTSVRVSWTAATILTGAPAVTSYRIERATNAAGPWTFFTLGIPDGTFGQNDTGLNDDTTYYYRVSALSCMGCFSEWSTAGMVTTERADPPPMATAATSSANPAEGAQVMLTATGSDEDAAGTPMPVTYAWTQSPANTVVLSAPTAAVTAFRVPQTLTAPVTVTFTVRVTGSANVATTATVMVNLNGVNNSPVVSSSVSTNTAMPGTMLLLTGNATDIDHDDADIEFAWACPVTADATFTQPDLMFVNAQAANTAFTVPALTDAAGNSVPLFTLTCTLTATSGGEMVAATPLVIAITTPAGEVVDNAVLPEVLRNIPAGINRSIFQRIQERQRQDGKWQ